MVEKILAPHERLRGDWPVEGTTGYDYLNLSLGLLIDPSAEAAFSDAYRAFAGADGSFDEIALASKARIMDNEMASELGALGRAAARLARQSPMTADLTRAILTPAVKAIVACFPVYRTYVDLSGALTEADRRDITWAVTRAPLRSRRPSFGVRFSRESADRGDQAVGGKRDQPDRGAALRDEAAAVLGAGDGQRASRTPPSIATTDSSP